MDGVTTIRALDKVDNDMEDVVTIRAVDNNNDMDDVATIRGSN